MTQGYQHCVLLLIHLKLILNVFLILIHMSSHICFHSCVTVLSRSTINLTISHWWTFSDSQYFFVCVRAMLHITSHMWFLKETFLQLEFVIQRANAFAIYQSCQRSHYRCWNIWYLNENNPTVPIYSNYSLSIFYEYFGNHKTCF